MLQQERQNQIVCPSTAGYQDREDDPQGPARLDRQRMVPYFEQQGALAMSRSVSHAWLQLIFRCSGAMMTLMLLS